MRCCPIIWAVAFIVQNGKSSGLATSHQERQKRMLTGKGVRGTEECITKEDFVEECYSGLASNSARSDGILSQHEYKSFLDSITGGGRYFSDFWALPFNFKLDFAESVCRQVEDFDEDNWDCMDNILNKNLSSKKFGLLFGGSEQRSATTIIQRLCRNIYWDVLESDLIPQCPAEGLAPESAEFLERETLSPSLQPSKEKSMFPSIYPSFGPTKSPSVTLSRSPSIIPSSLASIPPSPQPSLVPSMLVSMNPSPWLSTFPSFSASIDPTSQISPAPSFSASIDPSSQISPAPSFSASMDPSRQFSPAPSFSESMTPSSQHRESASNFPSPQPSTGQSVLPSSKFSFFPTSLFFFKPSDRPSFLITAGPSNGQSDAPSMDSSATDAKSQPSTSPKTSSHIESTVPSGGDTFPKSFSSAVESSINQSTAPTVSSLSSGHLDGTYFPDAAKQGGDENLATNSSLPSFVTPARNVSLGNTSMPSDQTGDRHIAANNTATRTVQSGSAEKNESLGNTSVQSISEEEITSSTNTMSSIAFEEKNSSTNTAVPTEHGTHFENQTMQADQAPQATQETYISELPFLPASPSPSLTGYFSPVKSSNRPEQRPVRSPAPSPPTAENFFPTIDETSSKGSISSSAPSLAQTNPTKDPFINLTDALPPTKSNVALMSSNKTSTAAPNDDNGKLAPPLIIDEDDPSGVRPPFVDTREIDGSESERPSRLYLLGVVLGVGVFFIAVLFAILFRQRGQEDRPSGETVHISQIINPDRPSGETVHISQIINPVLGQDEGLGENMTLERPSKATAQEESSIEP